MEFKKSFLALLCAGLAANSQAALINATWTAPGGGDYSTSSNWSSSSAPLNNAFNQYNVSITSNASVTYSAGTSRSIERLTIDSGDSLMVNLAGSALTINQRTDSDGAILTARNGGVLTMNGLSNIHRSSLQALESAFGGAPGATITTTATSYQGTVGNGVSRYFRADGSASVVDLSSLNGLTRNYGVSNTLSIQSFNGGLVDLSGIGSFSANGAGVGNDTSWVRVTADDAGSVVDLSGVTQIADRISYQATDGGTILGSLVSATNATLIKGGNGSVLDFSALLDATDSDIEARDGGIINLAASFDGGTVSAVESAVIGSPGAQLITSTGSYTGKVGNGLSRYMDADGDSTLLDLSSLSSFTRNYGSVNSLYIRALEGGTVDLSGISTFATNGAAAGIDTSSLRVIADGANSSVDVSGISSIADRITYQATNGGTLVGSLVSATSSTLIKGGSGSVFDFSALLDATNSTVEARDGGIINLAATFDSGSLYANELAVTGSPGAQLTTSVNSYTGAVGNSFNRYLQANGESTVLDISSLNTLTRNYGQVNSLYIQALDGGTVDLSGISSIDDNTSAVGADTSVVRVIADGADSLVDVSGISSIANRITYQATNGGRIDGSLVNATNATLILGGSGSVLDFSALVDATGSTIEARDGGVINLAASFDGGGLQARQSAVVGTPNASVTTSASSYTGTLGSAVSRYFLADGENTLVDASSITSFTRNYGTVNSILIQAFDGGTVDLGNVTVIQENSAGVGTDTSAITVRSEDAGSFIDLGGIAAMRRVSVTFDKLGSIDLGSLSSYTDATLKLDSTAGAADVQVANDFHLGDDGIIDTNGGTQKLIIGGGNAAATLTGAVNVWGGNLTGTGTVIGNLFNAGSVGPGASPGTLTVDGDYIQDALGSLLIEVGDLGNFDVLEVTGVASLAGELVVDLWDSFIPSLGEEFVFLTASSVVGTFDTEQLAQANGFTFDVVYGADFVKLVFGTPVLTQAQVPVPGAFWLMLAGVGLLMRKRRAV